VSAADRRCGFVAERSFVWLAVLVKAQCCQRLGLGVAVLSVHL
jgi:hypothetical protein